MRIDIQRATLIALALVSLAGVAHGQASEVSRTSRVKSEGFTLARYTTTQSAAMYTAIRVGPGLALAGMTGNTRTHSYTVLVGAGTRVRLAPGIVTRVFVAGARTPTDVQLRLYMLPKATAGHFTLSAIGMLSQPLTNDGPRQISANPLSLSMRLTPKLQVGASVVADQVQGRPLRSAAGPSVQLRVRHVAISLDALRWRQEARDELRATFTVTR